MSDLDDDLTNLIEQTDEAVVGALLTKLRETCAHINVSEIDYPAAVGKPPVKSPVFIDPAPVPRFRTARKYKTLRIYFFEPDGFRITETVELTPRQHYLIADQQEYKIALHRYTIGYQARLANTNPRRTQW